MAQPAVDWEAIERSPEFQELVRRRRRFVIQCTVFFLSWYMGFILLAAYAEDFMGERIYQGLTVGYALALTQFLMVLVLGLMYLKRSENVYDQLADKVIERYAHEHDGPPPDEIGNGQATPARSGAGTTTGTRAATEEG